jgi:DNA invertase Pin-like site-specific DNA recombinase
MRSELVSDRHLARQAIIYIRQSSPHQVLTNQESLRLQYDLRRRACDLGWREQDVEVIDTDLGLSGAAASHREGFKDLIARVTLGHVGLVLSSEVTRLSRNCTDWYPLLDLCGFKDCLIGDREGVYDPGCANGRLLLGLKGTISEMELHTIRARLTAGLLNKAGRGDLALMLPVGLTRAAGGTVVKDPDQEVQARLDLIFATFLRVRSASKVLASLNASGLTIPRRGRFGNTVWRAPTLAAILHILKNPAYSGTFVYGRSRSVRQVTAAAPEAKSAPKMLPREQWRVVVKDKYPAYISWETFEKIQTMLRDNYAEYDRNKTRGVPRDGEALLHGIVYCGACGHKMLVQYKGGTCYLCNYLRQQHGTPVCQTIRAAAIDAEAVAAFFKALAPAELDIYARAVASRREAEEATLRAQTQQVERLRYRAALAERQYDQVDPDNRLVAAELERRWEEALRDLRQAETALAQARRDNKEATPIAISEGLKAAFTDAGRRLPELWGSVLTAARKKALLRCLIDKVVIHRTAAAPDTIHMRIIWRGGDTTPLTLSVAVGSLAALSSGAAMTARILELARAGHSDGAIAAELTAAGHRSPMRRDRVLPSTVQIIRLRHGIMQKRAQSHPRRIAGHLTIPQLAAQLNVPVHWIYDRIHNGTIVIARDERTRLYLFPDHPGTLRQLQKLRSGELQQLAFDPEAGFLKEYQDA